MYCQGGALYLYVQSLALKPTASRQKKLLDVLQGNTASCRLPYQDRTLTLSFGHWPEPEGVVWGTHIIYVLHETTQTLNADDFAWDQKFSDRNNTVKVEHIVPRLLATYSLGDQALSVLGTAVYGVQLPYSVGSWTCEVGRSDAVPKDAAAP